MFLNGVVVHVFKWGGGAYVVVEILVDTFFPRQIVRDEPRSEDGATPDVVFLDPWCGTLFVLYPRSLKRFIVAAIAPRERHKKT